MRPALWGPAAWDVFHLFALGYAGGGSTPTDDDRRWYATFYRSFGDVLPCETCRNNFERHMREMPVEDHLESRAALFDWTVRFHNAVNALNGKKQMAPDEAFRSLQRRAHAGSRDLASTSYNRNTAIATVAVLFALAVAVMTITASRRVRRT